MPALQPQTEGGEKTGGAACQDISRQRHPCHPQLRRSGLFWWIHQRELSADGRSARAVEKRHLHAGPQLFHGLIHHRTGEKPFPGKTARFRPVVQLIHSITCRFPFSVTLSSAFNASEIRFPCADTCSGLPASERNVACFTLPDSQTISTSNPPRALNPFTLPF